jgi:hypothetical protein
MDMDMSPIPSRAFRYDFLAPATGLHVETIRELHSEHRIDELYECEGRLLPREVLRGRFGLSGKAALRALEKKDRIDPRAALRDLERKALGSGPIDPRLAAMRMRLKISRFMAESR